MSFLLQYVNLILSPKKAGQALMNRKMYPQRLHSTVSGDFRGLFASHVNIEISGPPQKYETVNGTKVDQDLSSCVGSLQCYTE